MTQKGMHDNAQNAEAGTHKATPAIPSRPRETTRGADQIGRMPI